MITVMMTTVMLMGVLTVLIRLMISVIECDNLYGFGNFSSDNVFVNRYGHDNDGDAGHGHGRGRGRDYGHSGGREDGHDDSHPTPIKARGPFFKNLMAF